MKSCVAVMKFITARDVLIHYGGYDFMPSEKSIFGMCSGFIHPTNKQTNKQTSARLTSTWYVPLSLSHARKSA